jgi:outer membrane receptor protein involved in Fe transport
MTSTNNYTLVGRSLLHERSVGSSALAAAIALVLGVTPTARAADTSPQKPQVAGGLEEVIVTAGRREQTVQDIPYNISAVTGAQLQATGVNDLTGIARLVPGLQTADLGPRAASTNSTFIIRGLNTYSEDAAFVAPNLTVPLVSTYIDDVPLFTNLRLTDIQRIEVLRGPQGTLYGSGSVGGTVRVIHNPPTTDRTEFEVSTSAESTEHAANGSYAVDTVLNVPFGDRFAWRMSASYNDQAGFINANRAVLFGPNRQPVLADPASPLTSDYATGSLRGINSSADWHARNVLLWKMTDGVSAEFVYHHQHDTANGFAAQSPGDPNYTTSAQIPVQPMNRTVDMASVSVTADAGFATLTSSTSWYKNSYQDLFDNSGFESLFNSIPGYYGGYPRVTVFNFDSSEDRSFVQEFRLASKSNGSWDWIAGLFYQNEKQFITDPEFLPGFGAWSALPGSGVLAQSYYGLPNDPTQTLDSVAQTEGRIPPSALTPTDYYYNFTRTAMYREFATYGELTYKPTADWQFTGGARAFWDYFSQNIENDLFVCGPFCSQTGTNPNGITYATADKGFRDQIFKFNTSYKLTPDTTSYLTIAQGYRHGGANAQCATPTGSAVCYSLTAVAPLIPYKSDTAVNYEAGIKGFGLDRRIQYSAGVYIIDWKDIQLELFSVVTGTTLILNGNTARSQGVEAEVTAEVTDTASFTLSYAYNDSKLTADFIQGSFAGRDGDRLPYVSKNTASLAFDIQQPVAGLKGLRYHADAAYRSDFTTRLNDCAAVNSVAQCPAAIPASGRQSGYALLDGFTVLNASVTFQVSDRWEYRAYGNNLTNELGITAASLTNPLPRDNLEFVMRPRTFGLEARYRFK